MALALRQQQILQRLRHCRTFVDARVKWVRDPFLDFVVEREKNLFQALSFKNHILSDPSKSVPLSTLSLIKPKLHLSIPSSRFLLNHPSFFSLFHPSADTGLLPPRVRLTRRALSLHREESAAFDSDRYDAVRRLSRVLMLAGIRRVPVRVIRQLGWDLGLPHDFASSLLPDFPDFFDICEIENRSDGKSELAIEIVSWSKDLAISELERRSKSRSSVDFDTDCEMPLQKDNCTDSVYSKDPIGFTMSFPRGYDLGKKVKEWLQKMQRLPYISPYENAFHLPPGIDQAEKWIIAVLHEILWLTVSKKTEKENLLLLGEWLGFGERMIRKVLVHHPGIFYVSNKLRTQTVVLREAYRKDFLVEKHPLMAMRYRYIHLLNQMPRLKRQANC